jgi:hypothetical protein
MSSLWNTVSQGAKSYINLYNPVKKTEHFEEAGNAIQSLVWLVIICFAIYLSWVVNGKFDLIHFIIAICCPPFYIIYAFASTGGRGLF